MGSELHGVQMLVWDVPPAIECGARFSFKVGVDCSARCSTVGWPLIIRDAAGHVLASVAIGDTVWPGTALHYAEVELEAPPAEGLHEWGARLGAFAGSARHPETGVGFRVRTVPAPECVLRIVAIDGQTRAPIEGARVAAHPYRAVTNARGVAEIRLPKGAYRLFVSGRDYCPLRFDGTVESDATIDAELVPACGPSDAEIWS